VCARKSSAGKRSRIIAREHIKFALRKTKDREPE
jgi:hypothetical protein